MDRHTENFLVVSPINAKFCPVSVLVNRQNENLWEEQVDKPIKKLSAPEVHRVRQREQYKLMLASLNELLDILPDVQMDRRGKTKMTIWKLGEKLKISDEEMLRYLIWDGFCLSQQSLLLLDRVIPLSLNLVNKYQLRKVTACQIESKGESSHKPGESSNQCSAGAERLDEKSSSSGKNVIFKHRIEVIYSSSLSKSKKRSQADKSCSCSLSPPSKLEKLKSNADEDHSYSISKSSQKIKGGLLWNSSLDITPAKVTKKIFSSRGASMSRNQTATMEVKIKEEGITSTNEGEDNLGPWLPQLGTEDLAFADSGQTTLIAGPCSDSFADDRSGPASFLDPTFPPREEGEYPIDMLPPSSAWEYDATPPGVLSTGSSGSVSLSPLVLHPMTSLPSLITSHVDTSYSLREPDPFIGHTPRRVNLKHHSQPLQTENSFFAL